VGTQVVILGTHLFAEEVADLVEQVPDHELAAFCENWDRDRCAQPLLGRPVVWIDDLADLAADHLAVCAIGTTRRRGFVEQAAAAGIGFVTLRHPTATVFPSARIGEGCILGAGTVVAARTEVGRHTILNRGVLVGHHARVGDYVTLSPAANVAGATRIGDGVYVGMGAAVLDRLEIGAGSVIGAGAVVTRDMPAGVQALGVPARVVREGVERR
jgi:sugar O-acyltransferase (sialic acid O-acetyltransferase NeuD family)